MASEERKGVQVWFVFLKEIDYQKAYEAGAETARNVEGVFNGLNIFTLGNKHQQALSLFADPAKVGQVAESITKALSLSNGDFLVQAVPGSQYVPRSTHNQTAT